MTFAVADISRPIANGASARVTRTRCPAAVASPTKRTGTSVDLPFFVLPFIAEIKVLPRGKRISYWDVPHTEDYGLACKAGRQYAGDFIQYLKDAPARSGSNTLGRMVMDMAAYPLGTPMHGYEVGFWSTLEDVLYATSHRVDHRAIIQKIDERYDAIEKARSIEESGL